jgi:hypothetical protein
VKARYGTIDEEFAVRMATTEPSDDGPIWMVNFMKYRPVADYADGRAAAISGREADDLYSPVDVLAEIGAEIALFGDVAGGEPGGRDWDRVAIVVYPTRRSFVDMQSRQDFQALHVHKEAGMEFTIILGALPLALPNAPAEAPTGLDLTAYPAGSVLPPRADAVLRLAVEGVIVGDERRFAALDIAWSDAPPPPAPEGALSVRMTPMLDRIRALVR